VRAHHEHISFVAPAKLVDAFFDNGIQGTGRKIGWAKDRFYGKIR
jgi:hypothetical protein